MVATEVVRTKVAKEKVLPFKLHKPNKLTAETLAKCEKGIDVHKAKNAADLFRQLDI